MTRTEAEAWMGTNFAKYSRVRNPDGSMKVPTQVVFGQLWEFEYNLMEVLADASAVYTVKLQCESDSDAGAVATWKNGGPKMQLKNSVAGVEDQLKAWALDNIPNAISISQIRPIQLDAYPRAVICKVAQTSTQTVTLKDFLVNQATEGATPTAYEVV